MFKSELRIAEENIWLWSIQPSEQGLINDLEFKLFISEKEKEYIRKINKIAYEVNQSKSIVDIQIAISGLYKIWIPIKNYILKYNDRIISFLDSIDNWKMNWLSTWWADTVWTLLNVKEVDFEEVFLSNLSNDAWSVIDRIKEWVDYIIDNIDQDIDLLASTIVEKIISIVEYNIAYEKSMIDDLTQIWNKRAYEIDWKEEFEKALENPLGNPLTIICLDIDRFKCINDSYWHNWWDLALCEISRQLNDVVTKYGGKIYRIWWEEFSVILPNKSKEQALKLSKELSKILWKINLREEDTWVSYEVTASIWMVVFDKKWKYNKFWEMVKNADFRAYKAKRLWRNMIVSSGDSWEKEELKKWQLVLNMHHDEIDYDTILESLADKLQRFIATLVVQKQKIENGESISSLGAIDWTYRQVAYLANYIFQTKWYDGFEWLKEALGVFIWDNWNKPWIDRFLDVDYLIEKWKFDDIKRSIISNPIDNRCSSIHIFLQKFN